MLSRDRDDPRGSPRSFLYSVDPATSVATITLNRPERLNALTFEVYAELRDTFRALDTEPDVRAIIITGAGRAFCSGGDVEDIIGALFSRDAAGLLEFTRLTGDLILSIRHCRRPVVAALNGTVAGAGAVIAAASDIRIAAESAKIAFLFTRVGLPAPTWARRGCCPVSSGWPRERAPHAGRLHQRASARRRSASTTAWSRATGCWPRRPRSPPGWRAGPSAALGVTKQALNEEAAMDLVAAIEWRGPGPGRAACSTPISARPTRPSAPSASRGSSNPCPTRRRSAPSSSRVTPTSPDVRGPSRRRHRPAPRADRTIAGARKEARALLQLLGAGGWLQPILDLDLRGLLPDARGAGRGLPARRRSLRPAGAGHDADPPGRIAGAEGSLARADRPRAG